MVLFINQRQFSLDSTHPNLFEFVNLSSVQQYCILTQIINKLSFYLIVIMTALKNPYLSKDLQNLLIRKNYNVIRSPQKQSLYSDYVSNLKQKNFVFSGVYELSSKETFSSNKGNYSQVSFKNTFSGKALGQINQNFQYYSRKLPPFQTQPYIPQAQKRQLPFPSYNRPQKLRLASIPANKFPTSPAQNRVNSAVLLTQPTSLQKNPIPYRPHFITPSYRDWNNYQWKKQLEKQQRKKLRMYGPESLRFQNTDRTFNQEYYSTKHVKSQPQTHKIRITGKAKQISRKQSFGQDQEMVHDSQKSQNSISRPPLNIKATVNSSRTRKVSGDFQNQLANKQVLSPGKLQFLDGQVRQRKSIQDFQGKIQDLNSDQNFIKKLKISHHFQDGNSSLIDEHRSFVKEQYLDIQNFHLKKFQSKQDDDANQNAEQNKGPLDLDAFDSGQQNRSQANSAMMERRQSSASFKQFADWKFGEVRNSQYEEKQSQFDIQRPQSKTSLSGDYYKHETNPLTTPQKDYSNKIEFRDHIYYRLKLTQDNE